MYERSRLHPPFTALVWRFPQRCVLDGPSIEPDLAAVGASHTRLPSPSAFPASCIRMHLLYGESIPLGSLACCTFYYTDEASRLLTDTTKKIDTQRFQVAAEWHAVMGTSVPGLPVRDCAKSCHSSVPRSAKVSIIDVTEKTIFENFVFGSKTGNTLPPIQMSLCTHNPTAHRPAISRFPNNFFDFAEIQK